jgi:putative flippase GtrA
MPDPERLNLKGLGPLFAQLVRFGLVGLFSTLVYDAVYWPLATYLVPPLVAVVIGFAVAVSIGYPLHSRWSFKGHGSREAPGRTQARFVGVQSGGLAFNALCTWLLTGPLLHGPTWWPLIPATFVTPILTFVVNRQWAFA